MGRHSEMELHSGINRLEYTSMINENDDRGLYPFSKQNTYLRTDWVIVVRWHACSMYPYSLLCRLVNVLQKRQHAWSSVLMTFMEPRKCLCVVQL